MPNFGTIRQYFVFYKAAAILAVLKVSSYVVQFALLELLTAYLSQMYEDYSLRKVIALANIREGISESVVIILVHISRVYLHRFDIIFCSSAFYAFGLMLLIPAYSNYPESKSFPLTITGLIILAVGHAGLHKFLSPFLADVKRDHDEQTNQADPNTGNETNEANQDPSQLWVKIKRTWAEKWAPKVAWNLVAWICGSSAALLLNYFCRWYKVLLISAGLMLSSSILLLLSFPSYIRIKVEFISSNFAIPRVLKAAALKRKVKYPSSSDGFFGNNGSDHLSPQIKFCRWLDKAAIIEYSEREGKREIINQGRLCTMSQVQDVKLLLKWVPLWTTFLAFALVVSTGRTFYSEQGENNMYFSNLMVVLALLEFLSRQTASYLFKSLLSWAPEGKKEVAKMVGIGAGMMLSIVFCVVALQIEARRLKIVKSQEILVLFPDEPIPNMSIFWLVPQVCLLGFMEGLAIDGLHEFLIDQFPEIWKEYVPAINQLIIGIGSLISILSITANRSLFGSSLNNSRVDEYYKRLTIVSALNLCYYMYITTIYTSSGRASV